MRAIILAGGRGSRLQPLTQNLPKPLIPFFGRPLIERQIQWLVRYGITDIVISLGHYGSMIEEALGSTCDGARIQYVSEREPLGTAGAVAWALDHCPASEPTLVIPGDCLTDYPLDQIVESLIARPQAIGIALHRVADARQFGVVQADVTGRVTRIIEKPAVIEGSQLVNTGIYVIKPQQVAWPSTRPLDFAYDLFPQLIAEGQLACVEAEGYWSDLGTLHQYRESHFDVLRGRVNIPLEPDASHTAAIDAHAHIVDPVWLGDGVTIDTQATIGPNVVIGSGSYIGPWARLQNAVIGDNVFLGPGTRLEEAIIGDRVAIGGRCQIGRPVAIGTDTRIGWGQEIANGSRIQAHTRLSPPTQRRDLAEVIPS